MQTQDQTATAVANEARARGAHTHIMDGSVAPSRTATIEAIAEALAFPETGLRSADELYDRLTDLSWLPSGEHVLIWVGSDVLKQADPKGYLSIRSVLSDSERAHAAGSTGRDGRILTVALAVES